jgi:hypothetical protein
VVLAKIGLRPFVGLDETAYRRKPSKPFAVHRSASCDHGSVASSATVAPSYRIAVSCTADTDCSRMYCANPVSRRRGVAETPCRRKWIRATGSVDQLASDQFHRSTHPRAETLKSAGYKPNYIARHRRPSQFARRTGQFWHRLAGPTRDGRTSRPHSLASGRDCAHGPSMRARCRLVTKQH